MGENGGVEELFKKFSVEVGSPGIFSRKATREKFLREAINWGYKGRESEIAELKAEIAVRDKAVAEMKEKTAEKPEITPREYNLEQEAKYQKARAEGAVKALVKTIADWRDERAKLKVALENQEVRKTEALAEMQAKITGLENTISELQQKASEKPAITPREYSLEQDARYQKARAEESVEALLKAIADYGSERAALAEEIARSETETHDYMEKTKQLKEKIKKIIELVE